MTKRADELALKVMKLEEKNNSDPAEREERKKLESHMTIFGIPEFESQEVKKRRQFDIWVVKNYFRFLGFDDVSVVNVERVADQEKGGPQIKVTLENPDIQRKILFENNRAVRHERPVQIPLQLIEEASLGGHSIHPVYCQCISLLAWCKQVNTFRPSVS